MIRPLLCGPKVSQAEGHQKDEVSGLAALPWLCRNTSHQLNTKGKQSYPLCWLVDLIKGNELIKKYYISISLRYMNSLGIWISLSSKILINTTTNSNPKITLTIAVSLQCNVQLGLETLMTVYLHMEMVQRSQLNTSTYQWKRQFKIKVSAGYTWAIYQLGKDKTKGEDL